MPLSARRCNSSHREPGATGLELAAAARVDPEALRRGEGEGDSVGGSGLSDEDVGSATRFGVDSEADRYLCLADAVVNRNVVGVDEEVLRNSRWDEARACQGVLGDKADELGSRSDNLENRSSNGGSRNRSSSSADSSVDSEGAILPKRYNKTLNNYNSLCETSDDKMKVSITQISNSVGKNVKTDQRCQKPTLAVGSRCNEGKLRMVVRQLGLVRWLRALVQ